MNSPDIDGELGSGSAMEIPSAHPESANRNSVNLCTDYVNNSSDFPLSQYMEGHSNKNETDKKFREFSRVTRKLLRDTEKSLINLRNVPEIRFDEEKYLANVYNCIPN